MILVLAGRPQDKEIAELLRQAGQEVELVDLAGKKIDFSWEKLLQNSALTAVVDASHPFSQTPSTIVQALAEKKQLLYLRYLEKEEEIPEHPLIYSVNCWEDGAKKAGQLGKTIFLTTGSNNLETFLRTEECQGKRMVIRVLPDYKVIKKCQDLGFTAKDIIAMQGPFSKELNKSIFKAYGASVIVTRESGKRGGADNKIAAALALKIPVVVIRKPVARGKEVRNYGEILAALLKKA